MNKYEQIARDIYNDIASGKYEPGSQLALEKEMCALRILQITQKQHRRNGLGITDFP